ncbi:MAG: IS5 family transposase [Candidatus Thorarchaeota archaeon]
MTLSYDQAYDMAVIHHYDFVPALLMRICNILPLPESRTGRPPTYPLSSLTVLLALLAHSGMTYRGFCALIDRDTDLLSQLGISRAPHYSTLNRAMDRVPPDVLQRVVRLIASTQPPPRRVAVDSTGMGHSTGGEWFSVSCQEARRRRFHGLHAAVDIDTLMVTSVMVRDRPGGDAKMLIPLLEAMWTDALQLVFGDKAYLSRVNVTYIHSLGARTVIEPKRGLTGKARGHIEYARLVKEYLRDPDGWRKKYEYGKRSLVESVFGAVKVKFGGTLRSRCDNRRTVETLLKVVIYNAERANYLSWFNP